MAAAAATAAFAAGFAWQGLDSPGSRSGTGTDKSVAAGSNRAEALEELDEAVRARREKRISGALASLQRARRADPSLPGLNVAFAEIAFEEKQFEEMRKAATAARASGDHAADANVLLGAENWLSRGSGERQMLAAAEAAGAQFAEATETDFFAARGWYFWGDVLRYAGREDEGHRRALAALHRFQPWESSDVIAAKALFASAEAGETVFASAAFLPDSPWTSAVRDSVSADKPLAADFSAQAARAHLDLDPLMRASPDSPNPPVTERPVLPR